MEATLLAALLTIHLAAVVSTDCFYHVTQCLNTPPRPCGSKEYPRHCSISPYNCFRLYQICSQRETATESARSEVESSSSAYEVERNANSSESPADCGSQRRRCLDDVLKSCRSFIAVCSLTAIVCDISHDQCQAAENETVQSEVEASSGAYEVERNASSSESPAETVQSEVEASSGAYEVERNASSSESPAGAEIAMSEVESIPSASDVNRSASSLENPAGCGNELVECLEETWTHCSHWNLTCLRTLHLCYLLSELCEADEIENISSVAESRMSASVVDRKANSSENLSSSE